jgi:D-beta-D-heptose 7-phosphate kinase/D-beta-D-heptose 1-phosphate adenosyltransferase
VLTLKGPTRPINREDDRAELLAALECVDAVTVFDNETPLALIEAIRPDVLVKGGDYRPEQVVGRAEVEAAGGRVVIVPLVEGQSSSRLIAQGAERTILRHDAPSATPPHTSPQVARTPLATDA